MSGRRIDDFDDPDAPLPNHLVPGVSVAVVNDVGQLLMIRRTDNDKWAIPGGAQEVGETVRQAALREVFEETGITCVTDGLIGIFSNPRNVVLFTSDGEVRQEFSILFRGRATGGTPTASSESREVVWCDRGRLLSLPMTPGQRRRIRYFLDYDGTPFIE